MMDERLLDELDATEEVRREGRSAVLRRAVALYLTKRRADQIRESYERAYGSGGGIDPEFDGWEEQGVWPDE